MIKITDYINENNSLFTDSDIPNRDKLFRSIELLGDWLYKSNGLGIMKIIDDIFTEYKYTSPLTEDQIIKFNHGLDILKMTSMPDSYINSQLRYKLPSGIVSAKLVLDDNGNWHHVNKLNTNYSDISDLLTELIMRGLKNNYEKGRLVYDSIIKDPTNGLLSIKPYLKKLIIYYFVENGNGIDDFKLFTQFSTKMSEIGERAEELIKNYFISKDFRIEYSGGNGDFIDMIFGTDLIVSHPDFGYKTVQIKNRIRDWSKLSHYKVDWIAETSPIRIYNLTDKTLVNL